MMDEFLGSIHFNQNAELILSSSYLTFQHWIGFLGFLTKSETDDLIKNNKSFMLSSLKTGKSMTSGISQARWVSNENFLAASDNGEVILYKLNKEPDNMYESIMLKLEHDSIVTCLATSFNSNIALSGSEDCKIKMWDLKDELSIKTFKAHESTVFSLSLNPKCSQTFLSCSDDNRALIWDTRKETPAFRISHKFQGHPSACDWSSFDSNLIAIGSENGQMGVFDVRHLEATQTFAMAKTNERLIRKVEFNPRNNSIATGSEDCHTQVYKLNQDSASNGTNLEKIYENSEHKDYVTDLSWNPLDCNEYLTASWDGTIKKHLISN